MVQWCGVTETSSHMPCFMMFKSIACQQFLLILHTSRAGPRATSMVYVLHDRCPQQRVQFAALTAGVGNDTS